MRTLNEIIIHCSATRPNWMKDNTFEERILEITKWHVVDRGWSDIGYHYIIDRDGSVLEGRPLRLVGAHVLGHNQNTIGICLLGGHGSEATDAFEKNFTANQRVSLLALLDTLQNDYGKMKITGHNQYANKACPGFSVPAFLKANTLEVEEKSDNVVTVSEDAAPTEAEMYRWRFAAIRDYIEEVLETNGKMETKK